MSPEISVLMPAYNAELYILSAISSVLNQTFRNFELIILNDGSTDKTQELIDGIKDPRIRALKNENNMGLAITRNKLMLAANCNFLAILDSDDLAEESRLEKQLDFLKLNPQFGLVASGCQLIDNKDKVTGFIINRLPAPLIPPSLLFRNYFLQSSVLINRSLIPDLNYDLSFPPAEDYELWCRIADAAPVYSLPETLIKYRIHGNNISMVRKDLLDQNISNVLLARLALLGIEPDMHELALHAQFGNYRFSGGGAAMLQWLLKLKEANKERHIYETTAFNKVISMNWAEFLLSSEKLSRIQKINYLLFNSINETGVPLFSFSTIKNLIKVFISPSIA